MAKPSIYNGRILVIGGGGYLGNVLCRDLLNHHYQVKVMDNFHKGQCDALLSLVDNPNFEFMYGDVTVENDCKKAVEDVDAIVHLAGIVGFPACARQPSLSKAVNVDGTINMLNANKYLLPFVFASTGSVYGKVEGICTEDTPCNTNTLYGLHKLEAEKHVREVKNTLSYRFATAFGVSPCMRVNLLVNDLAYQAVTNRAITVFEADARRTFIHIKDIATCFRLGIEKIWQNKTKLKVYNAGSNRLNHTKRDVVEKIRAKTGCHVTYAEVGKDLDLRDYEVCYDPFERDIMTCEYTMEQGIDELLKTVPLVKIIKDQYV